MRAPNVQGIAGWVLALLQGGKSERTQRQRQLRLIETLPLGGKRQLMLVECAGQSFLVGGGLESVQTILRLQEPSSRSAGKAADAPC